MFETSFLGETADLGLMTHADHALANLAKKGRVAAWSMSQKFILCHYTLFKGDVSVDHSVEIGGSDMC